MERQQMTLEEIRAGLGQVEEWCRVLRSAVERFEQETPTADQQIGQMKKQNCPPPESVYADQHIGPRKKSNCPPPEATYDA